MKAIPQSRLSKLLAQAARTFRYLSVGFGVAVILTLAVLAYSPPSADIDIGTDRFGIRLVDATSSHQHIGSATILTVFGPQKMVWTDVGRLRICLWTLPTYPAPSSFNFVW